MYLTTKIVCVSFKFKHSLSISLYWKTRKYLPPLTILLLRNSTNFAKVNSSEINQNAWIAKISICKKISKFPKWIKKKQAIKKIINFYLKKLQLFFIFLTNVSKWKYIKCWSVKRTFMYLLLCRSYYFRHIASII